MKLKRLLCIFLVGIFIGCMIPSAAFAVDPQVVDYGQYAGAIIYDLYGAANNTSLAFDSIQPGPALTEIITLYQEAQSQAGGDPVSLTTLGTALLAAGAIGVVYDAGEAAYQLAVTLDYNSFSEFYQDFNQGWDYILSDLAGLARSSGLFYWESLDPIEIVEINNSGVNGYPMAFLPAGLSGESYYNLSKNYDYNIVYTGSDVLMCLVHSSASSTIYYPMFFTDGSTSVTVTETRSAGSNPNPYTVSVTPNNNYHNGISWNKANSLLNSTNNPGPSSGNVSKWTTDIPIYIGDQNNPENWLGEFSSNSVDIDYGNIDVQPSTYIGDPLQNPLEISIPDPASPMPENQPIHIGTNIPADPEYLPESIPADPQPGIFYPIPADDPGILEQFWNDIVTDPDVEVDPNPDFEVDTDPGSGPDGSITEVFTPLLPTTLPSFDFNFSSIWHYVREWVNSLRSFFTVLFSVWAALPYAIVVPVYATAVIVIVLGVYKRFFG